jgi:hypothetical protein
MPNFMEVLMIYLKKIEGCEAQKLLAVRKSRISNFNDPT